MKHRLGTVLLCAVMLASIPLSSAGQGTVETVSASPEQLVLHLPPVSMTTESGGNGIVSFDIPGYGHIRQAGYPVLPRITKMIAVPAGTKPTLHLIQAEWAAQHGMSTVPWQTGNADFEVETVIPSNGLWPEEAARIAWTGSLRGSRVALVEFYPVRYRSDDGAILASRGITLEIRFLPGGSEISTSMSPAGQGGDPYFDFKTSDIVANPEQLVSPGPRPYQPFQAPAGFHEDSGTDGAAIAPVKFSVESDGLYAVTGADLQAAGVDLTGVDPRELVLYNMGLPVDILVEGESDGVFDTTDTIVFYGHGLDTCYTATNIYWLESDSSPGPRVATRAAAPTGGVTDTSFRNFVRREDSLVYTSNSPPAQSDEHWWWERLDTPAGTYPSSSDAYRTTLLNLPAGGSQARLMFNVQGRSSQYPRPDHRTKVYVNGNPVDDQEWESIASFTHDVLFDSSYLVDGENIITLEQVQQPGVPFASLYSNWFSLEYDDTFTAEADVLPFDMPAGAFTVEVDEFTSSEIQVFDVTDPAAPVLLTGVVVETSVGGWLARFQESPDAGKSYLAVSTPGRSSTVDITKDTPSDLRSTLNGADLIVITHPDFRSAAQPLLDRRSAEGLRTKAVLIGDVMDEFSDGIYTPEAIRDFLQYAYGNWEPPAPAFVLLLGDANLDYRDYLGYGNDFIPTKLTPNLPSIGEVMTDNYYARVDGSDLLPDLYIGRIGVRTALQAETAIDKIVEYSLNPPAATVSDSVVLVADDGLSSYDSTFEGISNLLADAVPDTMSYSKIYARLYADNPSIELDIETGINNGALITNYLGHGNRDIWGSKNGASGNFYELNDIAGLTNGADQTFALALNCTNGYFGDFSTPFTMGEEWQRLSNGGIGGYSPSGLGFIGDYDVLNREIFRKLFEEHDSLVGSVIIESLIRAYAEFGIAEDNMDELILFGDPSMHFASDVDRDTLLDREEVEAGSDPGDSDGDDDGLSDDQEPSWDSDSDGDGRVNALDPDSDDDGLPDGLESGLTAPAAGTDTSAGNYIADQDPFSTTDPLDSDTDGGGAPDGAEDRNVNGMFDGGETDPENPADDPTCPVSKPAEIQNLVLDKDGDDLILSWDDMTAGDPCLLYRVYISDSDGVPDQFSDFSYTATVTTGQFRHHGAMLDAVDYHYLVTAVTPLGGEGDLGHYGQ